jgi:hypothetical protein
MRVYRTFYELSMEYLWSIYGVSMLYLREKPLFCRELVTTIHQLTKGSKDHKYKASQV